jgi:NitT/TauT family transport system substrate-binding protein
MKVSLRGSKQMRLMVVSALLMAVWCSSSSASASTSHSSRTTTVNVAYVPLPLFAPMYVAMHDGYFAKEGIKVHLTSIASGQSAVVLAASNRVQVVLGGFSAGMFNAIKQGLSFKVVGSMAEEAPGAPAAALVVAPSMESTASTPAGLKGQKIAVDGGNGAAGSYLLAQMLAPDNLTLSDVTLVNLQFPEMEDALKSGAVAAAVMSSPFLGIAVSDGNGKVLATEPVREAVTGVIYGGAFAKTPAAQKFFDALVQGAKRLQGSGAVSTANLKIIAAATSEPLAALKSEPPNLFQPKLAPPTATLTDMQKVFAASKALSYSTQIPSSRYVDNSFSANAK